PGFAQLVDLNGDGLADLSVANNQSSAGVSVWLATISEVHFELLDPSGNVVATGTTGATNVTEAISNFIASDSGTYYLEIEGVGSFPRNYTATVERGATFGLEDNSTIPNAQNIDPTGGVLGSLIPPATVTVTSSFEGIDFNGSNCGCLPPDTNA